MIEKKEFLGKKIKGLKLPTTAGGFFDLDAYRGKKIVLFFYPKDNTPGCTVEGQEFNQSLKDFTKLGILIFGISRDSLKSHEKFKCKFEFDFDLLSDEEEVACKMFDVIKEKNMYGKKVMGIERSTFVLDADHRVIGEFRKVKAEGHAKEILTFAKKELGS